MAEMRSDHVTSLLRDSAVIITAVTVLLFIWGFALEGFQAVHLGLPASLTRQQSIQEYLVLGGFVALFVYGPAAISLAVAVAVIRKLNRRARVALSTWTWQQTATMSFLVLALSVILLAPISEHMGRHSPTKRVVKLRLVTESATAQTFEGWYLISITDQTFVFTDRPMDKAATLRLLKRDQVLELSIISDDTWQAAATRSKKQQPSSPKNQ